MGRIQPNFTDGAMVHLIPPNGRHGGPRVLSIDPMCKESQAYPIQIPGSPRLQASPGDWVGLQYQENGHVTLPNQQVGKPKCGGSIYVYGTSESYHDEKLQDIHKRWNFTGDGGDGRGNLLAVQNFDDGTCYQINNGSISQQRQNSYSHTPDKVMGADLWCHNLIRIPIDAPASRIYTLYWVWDWPTAPGTPGFPNGKDEIYTTCIDVNIVDPRAI